MPAQRFGERQVSQGGDPVASEKRQTSVPMQSLTNRNMAGSYGGTTAAMSLIPKTA